jgi:hypothetical protein
VWLFEFKLLAGCVVLIVVARAVFIYARVRRAAAQP